MFLSELDSKVFTNYNIPFVYNGLYRLDIPSEQILCTMGSSRFNLCESFIQMEAAVSTEFCYSNANNINYVNIYNNICL